MFENQPKGLYALALANTGERFGYYTMIAVFALFLRANFGLTPGNAGLIYSIFLALVYVMPLVGGALADKFGYGKMVTIGIIVMFLWLPVPRRSIRQQWICHGLHAGCSATHQLGYRIIQRQPASDGG